MNVSYDSKTDTVSIDFAPGEGTESDEDKPGVILGYDTSGNLFGIEILDSSQRIPDLTSVNLSVAI